MSAWISLSVPMGMASDVDTKLARVKSRRGGAAPGKQAPVANDPTRERRARVTFAMEFARDLERWHLPAMGIKQLAEPFVHRNLLRSAVTLKAGRGRRFGPLELKVKVSKLALPNAGSSVARKHTVLVLHNRSDKHLAYRVQAGIVGRGNCRDRGQIARDTLTIAPGERVRLSMCQGKKKVRLKTLEVTSVPQVAALYLQQLPPELLALDARSPKDHRLRRGVRPCANVPVAKLKSEMTAGRVSWLDVVDFYGRHNCQRWQMPLDYRRKSRGPGSLPALAAP